MRLHLKPSSQPKGPLRYQRRLDLARFLDIAAYFDAIAVRQAGDDRLERLLAEVLSMNRPSLRHMPLAWLH